MTERLVAVQRNHHGNIISFQTSSGRVISYRKAIQEATDGVIIGVNINEEQNEMPILTSTLDTDFNDYPLF